MKNFSVARAYSAGVDLIERKPWTLVWWAAATIVLLFLPRLFIPGLAGGMNEWSGVRDVWASAGNPEAMKAASAKLQAMQSSHSPGMGFLWMMWSLFVSAILYNAAYRAVLQPNSSSFGYLRIGMAEVWQFLVLIVQFLLVLAYVVALVLVIFVAALIAKAAGPAAAGWIMAATFILLLLLTLWLSLRLSLGQVATFAQGKFAYFNSWGLTKGRVWRLFWTSFLTLAMLIGLYCMFFFTVLLAVLPLSMITRATGTPTLEPMTQGPPTVPTELLTIAAVGLAVWLVVASLISAVVHALALAPWAAAYKGLTSEGGEHG